MENITTYRVFELGSYENTRQEEIENLSEMLGYLKEGISLFFKERGMDADFVEVDDPESFIIEYFPQAPQIPKKISYYIDELCEMLSKQMKSEVDWRFSPHGAYRLILYLDDPVNVEHLKNIRLAVKTKQRLKLT